MDVRNSYYIPCLKARSGAQVSALLACRLLKTKSVCSTEQPLSSAILWEWQGEWKSSTHGIIFFFSWKQLLKKDYLNCPCIDISCYFWRCRKTETERPSQPRSCAAQATYLHSYLPSNLWWAHSILLGIRSLARTCYWPTHLQQPPHLNGADISALPQGRVPRCDSR